MIDIHRLANIKKQNMIRLIIGITLITSILTSCKNSVKLDEKNLLNKIIENRDVEYEILVQRATQTAIWAMPAVGIIDFQKASQKYLGVNVNEVIYLSRPFTSRHGFLTANDVTNYAWGNLNNEKGPLVLEVPPAGDKVFYFGTIVNVWDQPIEDVGPPGADKGIGGKYLLVPPDFTGTLPKEGYIIRNTDTYSIGFAFRPILKNGGTYDDAVEYAKGLKIYYLKDADNPPPTKYTDAYDSDYDCLPYYDETFFQDINDFVQQNPVRPQDKVMINLLKDLGIEKGKTFAPNDIQKKAIAEGLKLAFEHMQKYFIGDGKACIPLWKGKNQWLVWNFAKDQPQTGFPYESEEEVLVDNRAGGSYFWITYLPKYLGGGTFYLTGLRDSEGNLFNGSDTYLLNVPKDTPAKDFWSVIAYSMKTKGFIRNAEKVGLSSRQLDKMQVNEDGSVDIYFAPEAPQGRESNWIPTGEDFFLLFRLYGPESNDFYKSWVLGDIEKVK